MAVDHWSVKFIGVPWTQGGGDWSGVDCLGLAELIYREECVGEFPDYRAAWAADPGSVVNTLDSGLWEAIPAGQERDYDIVVFRALGGPPHVGVVAGGGDMIHAARGSAARLDSYRGPDYVNRIAGFYRLRPLIL